MARTRGAQQAEPADRDPAAENATAPAYDPTSAVTADPDQGPDPPPPQPHPEPGVARGFTAGRLRWLRNRLRPPVGGRQPQ